MAQKIIRDLDRMETVVARNKLIRSGYTTSHIKQDADGWYTFTYETVKSATVRDEQRKAFRVALAQNNVETNTRGDFTYQVRFCSMWTDQRTGRTKNTNIYHYTDDLELADKIVADYNAMAPEKQANARAYAVVAKRRTKTQFTSEFNRNEK